MATKQRVFSPNNTIHYDDYLKIKRGTECLKTTNHQIIVDILANLCIMDSVELIKERK